MSHMVIFQAPGGSPGYKQFETLDEAVVFVESLRNEQNVTNARMFALEEIKFELKPFFKVELQALNPGEAPPVAGEDPQAQATPAPAEQVPAPMPPQDEPAPAPMAEPAPEPAAAQTFGAFTEQAPAEPAPAAPAPQPEPAPAPQPEPAPEQPVRRGLFGR